MGLCAYQYCKQSDGESNCSLIPQSNFLPSNRLARQSRSRQSCCQLLGRGQGAFLLPKIELNWIPHRSTFRQDSGQCWDDEQWCIDFSQFTIILLFFCQLIQFPHRQFTILFIITVIPNYNVSCQRNWIRGFKLCCLITSNTYCWVGHYKFRTVGSQRHGVSNQPSWGSNVKLQMFSQIRLMSWINCHSCKGRVFA